MKPGTSHTEVSPARASSSGAAVAPGVDTRVGSQTVPLARAQSAVDAAQPQAQAVELRDTLVPGFLWKITPAGRKVFMLQYRTNASERRKPALGLYGELTVEQARSLAQEWLAQGFRLGDAVSRDMVAARFGSPAS
jgi:hypothetical protein